MQQLPERQPANPRQHHRVQGRGELLHVTLLGPETIPLKQRGPADHRYPNDLEHPEVHREEGFRECLQDREPSEHRARSQTPWRRGTSGRRIRACQKSTIETFLRGQCFMRNRDLSMIELAQKWEKNNKKLDAQSEALLGAESFAYQGKYVEAGNLLVKSGMPDKAVELFTELKRWDDAKAFAKKGDIVFRAQSGASRAPTGRLPTAQGQKINAVSPPTGNGDINPKIQMNKLLKEQAEWTKETGDWKTAADLFVACGDFKKAIELYGKESFVEGLIDVCRQIDKVDNAENIQLCAQFFRKLKHHGGAKEAFLKLGDTKSLMQLHVDFERWEEAFAIGRQNPELLELAKVPYAEYLLKNDRYEEALRAFKSAGRFDLTTKMMREISKNCVNERRFEDASHYFWELAIDALTQAKLRQYEEFSDNSEIYFAYQKIYNFIEEPFQPLSGEAYMHLILNAARFLVSKAKPLYGVNMSYVYYALGKVSKELESFKTARLCYEKLSQYKIPPEWSEEIDLHALMVRSKPFSDSQLHEPFCNRCMNQNPIISKSDKCASCNHPIVSSFLSFNALPVVEFKVPPNISLSKVLEFVNRDKSNIQTKKPQKKKQQVQ